MKTNKTVRKKPKNSGGLMNTCPSCACSPGTQVPSPKEDPVAMEREADAFLEERLAQVRPLPLASRRKPRRSAVFEREALKLRADALKKLRQ